MSKSDSNRTHAVTGTLPYLSPKYAGYLGLLTILIFTICNVIGAFADEEWVLFEDNLCVLGVSEVGFVRVLYPFSCTIAGLGFMLFGYSVAKSCNRKLQAYGYYACISFGISFLGIGAITIDFNYDLHMAFVFLLGLSAGIALGLITVDDIILRKWAISIFVILIAIAFALLFFLNTDYIQAIVIPAMMAWLVIKCRNLIVNGSAY